MPDAKLLGERADERVREHRTRAAAELLGHVHHLYGGQRTPVGSLGQHDMMPGGVLRTGKERLDGRRGRTEHHGRTGAAGHPHGHVARVVARSAVLLVGALMLFVDDDEAHVAQRRKQRRARAHHHTRCSRANEVPLVEALTGAHARVHNGHGVAEAPAKARHCLRRERYLRHEHACRVPCSECCLDGLKIYLGLARAGDAVDEHHLPRLACTRCVDSRKRFGLALRKRRLAAGNEERSRRLGRFRTVGRFRRPAGRRNREAPHPPAALDANDALALQRLESDRHRAEFCSELRHAQLARAQRRHDGSLLDGILAGLEPIECRTRHHPAVVHLADGRFLEPPVARVRAHHARHASRRREQAHAR